MKVKTLTKAPALARWYLVQCKSRQEDRAEENLRNQHFSCYCPRHLVEKMRYGKRTVIQQPLFPGYLFINLCRINDNWDSIRSTRGVLRMVTFAGQPLPVPDEIINELRARLAIAEGRPLFREGQPVTFTEEPFRGLDAVFCKADGEERAIVLLSLLHRQQELKVPLKALKASN